MGLFWESAKRLVLVVTERRGPVDIGGRHVALLQWRRGIPCTRRVHGVLGTAHSRFPAQLEGQFGACIFQSLPNRELAQWLERLAWKYKRARQSLGGQDCLVTTCTQKRARHKCQAHVVGDLQAWGQFYASGQLRYEFSRDTGKRPDPLIDVQASSGFSTRLCTQPGHIAIAT